MPFYKYFIHTGKTSDANINEYSTTESKNDFDDGAFANQRMVNAMRHISQLIKIADDVFGAIEIECRGIIQRTKRLNIRLQNCHEIVDNLNAKAVKVPIGSLTGNQIISQHYKSCDVEKIDHVSIFSSIPRPTAVEHLRDLAYGPSPPVIIPSGMVASETEGLSGTISSSNSSSTHIYCKPVKIKNAGKYQYSPDSGDVNASNKSTSSDVKVPSAVVPIDVSGQTFSRMSTFRRSLIHVDFLIRRKKKKDKRRNTVAEGDVKELKDALQKIVIDDCKLTIPNTVSSYQQIIAESKNAYNSQVQGQKNDKFTEEQNNNAANVNLSKKSDFTNSSECQIILDERNRKLNSEGIKSEMKQNESENAIRQISSKRKLKSHIPISTVSAAMNVAVEMRQCNGLQAGTPTLNGVNNTDDHISSDPDSKTQENSRNSNSSLCTEDDSQQEDSWASYKKRLQEKCRTYTSNIKSYKEKQDVNKETEVSSSASSENIDPQDNSTVVGMSTESDTFFISSDESDEESSDTAYFQDNYGSSTSLGSASDGSLNSLLSETGTEMTSSTGTLTSLGREQLLTPPPPPPPPMILSATITEKDIVANVSESPCFGYNPKRISEKKTEIQSAPKKSTKQVKSPKSSKPLKTDIFEVQRNANENSKNIFTGLVSLKRDSHSKEKSKNKNKDRTKKPSHQPAFDMYGNNSPTKTKQIPAFIKENISPVIHNEEKSHMKSFFVNDSSKNSAQFSDSEVSEKSQSNSIPTKHSSNNKPVSISDYAKTKGVQSAIPQKYEHQVIVTPLQRCADTESKSVYYKGGAIAEHPISQSSSKCGNVIRPSSVNAEIQGHAPRLNRPQPPVTLQPERSKAARVVLDFDGKVIYSTNSLDRKHYNPNPQVNMYNSVQNKSFEPYFKERQINNEDICNLSQETCTQTNPAFYSYNSNAAFPHGSTTVCSSFNAPCNHNIQMNNRSPKEELFADGESYTSQQIYEPRVIYSPQYPHRIENVQTFVPKRLDTRPSSFAGNSSDSYLHNPSNNLLPNPNISGLPVQETMLTKHNVNLHSKHMEEMCMSSPESSFNYSASNSFYLSPSSEKSSGISNKSPQSTMSTEDLFAVIHNCKKRLNIKTDSDISLASSSRSSSPSFLRPSSSKGTLAETGFLSPRNQHHLETSGDRRSWADFRPVDSVSHERKSLASDRLGPTKPTSMHDFKMLLLQARSSSQISGPRKSAVEMLKVPLNQNNQNSVNHLPLNLSPRNSVSFSAQNSPSTEFNYHNGHSTVPFKRGNRVRTSLQSRYIMYPPIFEDCSEDSENCSDLTANTSNDESRIERNGDSEIQKVQEYSCDSENKFHSE